MTYHLIIISLINYGILFVQQTRLWNSTKVWHWLRKIHFPQRASASGSVHVFKKILNLNMSITQVRLMRTCDWARAHESSPYCDECQKQMQGPIQQWSQDTESKNAPLLRDNVSRDCCDSDQWHTSSFAQLVMISNWLFLSKKKHFPRINMEPSIWEN